MENSKVSIIITTYGGEWKLKRAIESILEQSYNNFEIIVVDDNDPQSEGRKRTERIMIQYKNNNLVRYIKHKKNSNGSVARNTGIKNCTGAYIAFLDDDDYYLKDRLKISINELKKMDDYGGICASVIKMKSGQVVETQEYNDCFELTTKDLFVNQNAIGSGSNIFLRKKVIDEIGSFDESFDRFQDLEYMIRVCNRFKIRIINKPLIVKDIEGARTPSYEKINNSFVLFCTKFEDIISSLQEEDKTRFYNDRFTYLFELAVYSGVKKNVYEAAKKLKTIRELNKVEIRRIKYLFISSRVLYFRRLLSTGDNILIRFYRKIKKKSLLNNYGEQVSKNYYYKFK